VSSATLSPARRTLRNKVSELHTRPAPSTSLELEYNKRLMVVSGRANPELAHRIASKLGAPDLRNALDALLAGKPIRPAETRSFGCSIDRS